MPRKSRAEQGLPDLRLKGPNGRRAGSGMRADRIMAARARARAIAPDAPKEPAAPRPFVVPAKPGRLSALFSPYSMRGWNSEGTGPSDRARQEAAAAFGSAASARAEAGR